MELGCYGGAWSTQYRSLSLVAVLQILKKKGRFCVHRGNTWHTLALEFHPCYTGTSHYGSVKYRVNKGKLLALTCYIIVFLNNESLLFSLLVFESQSGIFQSSVERRASDTTGGPSPSSPTDLNNKLLAQEGDSQADSVFDASPSAADPHYSPEVERKYSDGYV